MTNGCFVMVVGSSETRAQEMAQPASELQFLPSFLSFLLLPSLPFLCLFLSWAWSDGIGGNESRREWQEKRARNWKRQEIPTKRIYAIPFFPCSCPLPPSLPWFREIKLRSQGPMCSSCCLTAIFSLALHQAGTQPCWHRASTLWDCWQMSKTELFGYQTKLIFKHVLCCGILLTFTFSKWDVHRLSGKD